MRCSRKFSICLACVALATSGIAAKKEDKPKEDPKKESAKKKPKGDDKKAPATPAPTAAGDAAAKPLSKLSLPLPKGQDSVGVTIPYNDNTGRKTMNFRIGVATRVDDDHVKMSKLLIETFNDETGTKEMTIELPTSALDLNTRVITGHSGVTIKRSDFEITGTNMEFNTETKQGRLQGDVKMIIYNLSNETGSKPEAKPNE